MTPETKARLEQLVESWRAEASDCSDPLEIEVLDYCADGLSALLSSLEPPQAQEPTC